MYRCEAEIEAAREAGVKVIPCYSGDDYGATRSMLMRALCEPTALHPAHATYIGRGAWARTVGTVVWRLLKGSGHTVLLHSTVAGRGCCIHGRLFGALLCVLTYTTYGTTNILTSILLTCLLCCPLAAEQAKQVDKWVDEYKSHANFKYIFRENGRDVLNKQNPESVKRTLTYLAELC